MTKMSKEANGLQNLIKWRQMPSLGFGVYQVPDPNDCEYVVRETISVGYRSNDTAQAY